MRGYCLHKVVAANVFVERLKGITREHKLHQRPAALCNYSRFMGSCDQCFRRKVVDSARCLFRLVGIAKRLHEWLSIRDKHQRYLVVHFAQACFKNHCFLSEPPSNVRSSFEFRSPVSITRGKLRKKGTLISDALPWFLHYNPLHQCFQCYTELSGAQNGRECWRRGIEELVVSTRWGINISLSSCRICDDCWTPFSTDNHTGRNQKCANQVTAQITTHPLKDTKRPTMDEFGSTWGVASSC